jgi:membrane-associated phospholipid phosphatase
MDAMREARWSRLDVRPGSVAVAVYLACVFGFVYRIAYLDDWNSARWIVLIAFTATVAPDRIAPNTRNLVLGVVFFGVLSYAVLYLPDLWFSIAYKLNHAQNYLWNANAAMRAIPGNDGAFLWSHRVQWFSDLMGWVYVNGFDMVVWIPVVRSLAAFDARKMPFYTAFRVDEVWCVLGDPDRCQRGWSPEVARDLGANCFPSMHTSVAFAILLLGLREKSALYRNMMVVYASSIIFSTVYMEVHWLIDVAGGLVLGWVSVKLVDRLLARIGGDGAPAAAEHA